MKESQGKSFSTQGQKFQQFTPNFDIINKNFISFLINNNNRWWLKLLPDCRDNASSFAAC
ncbi:CLUMA_CG019774, isoform A [Clunio marinus]|uniref:CLUMA_CG019774, isoform A n=1 Tax=Clunio marinus TaxID=568069 RepID=A0A1J1J4A2_9DIPT|nr:CLUMA_CG019774, isoform A [Clunio marinus]